MKLKKLNLIVLLVAILVFVPTLKLALTSSSSGTFWISSGIYPHALSYTLWAEDSTYYAKNAYGQISPSETVAETILQDAIDALTTGTIFLKDGTFTLWTGGFSDSEKIYINNKNKIEIIGEGKGATLKVNPNINLTNKDTLFHIKNSNDIAFKNMKIVLDGLNDSVLASCFYTESSNRITFENVEFSLENSVEPYRIINRLLDFYQSDDILVSDCFFHQDKIPTGTNYQEIVYLKDCEHVTIRNSDFYCTEALTLGSYRNTAFVSALMGSDIKVLECSFENSGIYGVIFEGGGDNEQAPTDSVVANCFFKHMTANAISFYEDAKRCSAIGNAIVDTGHGAIALSPATGCVVSGNTLYTSTKVASEGGIEIENGHPVPTGSSQVCLRNSITDNYVEGFTWGIYVRQTQAGYDEPECTLIEGNTVFNCTVGINLNPSEWNDAQDTLVHGNFLKGNTLQIDVTGSVGTTSSDNKEVA